MVRREPRYRALRAFCGASSSRAVLSTSAGTSSTACWYHGSAQRTKILYCLAHTTLISCACVHTGARCHVATSVSAGRSQPSE
eukprot:6103261-Prymnesium_polylepis.1